MKMTADRRLHAEIFRDPSEKRLRPIEISNRNARGCREKQRVRRGEALLLSFFSGHIPQSFRI